jgi:putative urate catabolism protein
MSSVILAADSPYPRDFYGYGPTPPHAQWPGGARIAVQFVLNYEEGGEYTVLNGDAHSETFLGETSGLEPVYGDRNLYIELVFEYGSRAGVWRVLRLFEDRRLNLTVYAVGRALELNPALGAAFSAAGHEVASHGQRWINYQTMPEEEERQHIRDAIRIITETTGRAPVGWYTGRVSPQTRRLAVEEGKLLYDSDAYNDDLPYYVPVNGKPHLVIPYTLDNNDAKFSLSPGFVTGDQFFEYLKASFDTLYAEGADRPRMMSIGLHARIIGRPGRISGLARFLDYIQGREDVWICRREDIARHWLQQHPPR